MEIITKSAQESIEFGRKTGASLVGGEILALKGDLGSGKTTFVQGLAEGVGYLGRVTSPTFILMRQYPSKEGLTIYHIDLYRLTKGVENEMENIGLGEILDDPNAVCVIEWAEKIKNLLPPRAKWYSFLNLGGNTRRIEISEPEK